MSDHQIVFRNFTVPGNYQFGWDCVRSLSALSGNKPVLITDTPVMKKTGHLDRVLTELNQGGRTPMGIISVESEPGQDDVRNAVETLTIKKPDTIIALGGGAVLDTAKAGWYLYNHRHISIDQFFRDGPHTASSQKNREETCRLITIPTTSGTGSEVTCAVVFTNPQSGLKQVFISPLFIPSAVLLDPALTLSMPPSVTAASGFDALTHAVESYISTTATPFSRAAAREALLLITTNLPIAFTDGKNRRARENMLYAASLAGVAISNSCTGIAHSLDQVGPLLGIPHGETLASLFVPVLRYIAKFPETGLAELGLLSGFSGEQQGEQRLIAGIETMIDTLGLPDHFSKRGVSLETYQAAIEKTVPTAVSAFATRTSPVPADEQVFRDILEEAF